MLSNVGVSHVFFFSFLYFLFGRPRGIWSSWARGQIKAAVGTYTVAMATGDP